MPGTSDTDRAYAATRFPVLTRPMMLCDTRYSRSVSRSPVAENAIDSPAMGLAHWPPCDNVPASALKVPWSYAMSCTAIHISSYAAVCGTGCTDIGYAATRRLRNARYCHTHIELRGVRY
eukprot:850958-Rhodomonas_salina.3